MLTYCGKEGHLNSECFIKHPKKTSWFGKKNRGGGETSISNLEIQVSNIDTRDAGSINITNQAISISLSLASFQLIDALALGKVSRVFAFSEMLGNMLAVSDLSALTPLAPGNPSVMPCDISATKLESPSLMILRHPDIWIGDTGASYQSTAHCSGCINKRVAGSSSIGSTGEAVQATYTVDIPGHFMKRDGTLGSTGTLTEFGYSPKNNFNLLSIC
jgi:hypothetical protein